MKLALRKTNALFFGAKCECLSTERVIRFGAMSPSEGANVEKILAYQLLALDPKEETRADNAPDLLHMCRSYSALWDSPRLDEDTFQIVDGETTLHVGQVSNPTTDNSLLGNSFGQAFVFTLNGSFAKTESMREPLTRFLKDQKFAILYVLVDEFSERIACELYPYLYRIENRLRGYLIKFMSTRIGPAWWKATVSSDMDDKVRMRRSNERVFSKHVDMGAYLIDFGELGQLVYEQSSGFVTKGDIVRRIAELPETPEAIKDLKQDLQTNYQKFFKESFADKDFKEKWRDFEQLRNKIAHGNLFTAEDLERGKLLADEIEQLISTADERTEQLIISERERVAIQEAIIERVTNESKDTLGWSTDEITEDEFLRRLESHEASFKDGFVGVSLFLRNLTNMGYSYYSAQRILGQLERAGRVEIYGVPNPEKDYDTSAIRSANEDSKGTRQSYPLVPVVEIEAKQPENQQDADP